MKLSQKDIDGSFLLSMWGLSMLRDDAYNNLLGNAEYDGHMFEPTKFFMGTNIQGVDRFFYLFVHFEACEVDNKNKPPLKGMRVCKVEDIPEEIMPMFNCQFFDHELPLSNILDQDMKLGAYITIPMLKELLSDDSNVIKDLRTLRKLGKIKKYKEQLKVLNDFFSMNYQNIKE